MTLRDTQSGAMVPMVTFSLYRKGFAGEPPGRLNMGLIGLNPAASGGSVTKGVTGAAAASTATAAAAGSAGWGPVVSAGSAAALAAPFSECISCISFLCSFWAFAAPVREVPAMMLISKTATAVRQQQRLATLLDMEAM